MIFPTPHSALLKQMRFNVRFTPEQCPDSADARRTPTINHAASAFIENKR
jgi:hypothetical protein